MKLNNLVELLRFRAERKGCGALYTFLGDGDGETAHLTFGQLDQRARAIGAQLQKSGLTGERALLVFPSGLEFISAFFGCLYAGVVAIPVPLMGLRRACSRLQPILQDAEAKAILSTENVLSKLKGQGNNGSSVSSLTWLSTDTIADELADDWKSPRLMADSLAYLQYTSGSTADPKGVMVTHGNVLHNLTYIEQGCEYTPESILASWLPHFHDMGLVNGILQPLYQGCRGILMPPQAFVQRPIRWLRAISQYRASHSGGPNFAYEMCVSKTTLEDRKTLDLRSWILAYCGAEPVRRDTLVRFAETFQPHGFSWAAFCPCYGLAETTLKVSAKPRAEEPVTTTIQAKALEMNQVVELEPNDQLGKTLVSSGRVGFGMQVVIVEPETFQPCSSNKIGEIWVAGQSVARGYWNREKETQNTFRAVLSNGEQGPFLRTGDLGFLRDDQLFVTGRLKDLIIIRGNNYYPHDIEHTVDRSHASLNSGCGVAFSVERSGEEKLVVVQELKRGGWAQNTQKIIETIRRAVAEEHNLQVFAILLVRAGTVPKTSSGKVQRQACRKAYCAGQLNIIAESGMSVSSASRDEPQFFANELLPLDALDRAAKVQTYLQMKLARLLHLKNSQRFSVNDRLNAFGLDSLIIFELRQDIENVFGVVVSFSMLLDGPSLGELAQEIGHKMDRGSLLGNELRTSSRNECLFPTALREGLSHPQLSSSLDTDESLSYGQQGLWMLQQDEPETDAFHIRFSARVFGDLDVHAFQKALRALIHRHPALRTTFHEREGLLRQKVRQADEGAFRVIDASDWSTDVFKTMLAQEAYRPFDLKKGPLLRVLAFARGPKEWVLLMVVHHLNIDLWSMAIFVDELRRLYIAEKDGQSLTLTDLPSTYSNFVRWQAEYLAGPDGERLWNYWRNYLEGEPPVLRLPTDRPRLPDQGGAGAAHTFRLSTQLTQQLKALAHQQGTTLYVILLSAFQVLLSRYTNQEDFVIGSPVAGRTRPEFEGVLGYFVNVLPFRAELSGTVPFVSLISRNHRTVSQGLDHQDFPFPLLVERLGVQRDPGVPPLFQVMFVYERPHRLEKEGLSGFILGDERARLLFGDAEWAPHPLERRSSEMDLTLFLTEVGDTLQASFQYRTALFDSARMERMAEHLMTLLEGIVSSPQCRLSDLQMVTPAERQHMLIDWNQTLTKYPRGCSIHEVFEAQVERTPDQKAVMFQGANLTYRELNERANQVAHHLQELGVEPDQFVGICMERSLDMVIGLLGILKAGGAYIPLDPQYPEERLRFMMDDAHITVLLTQEQFRTRLDRTGLEVACLDSEWNRIERQSTENPRCPVTADGLAYVMYTSGSTGWPKGVCIPHRGVVRLVKGPDFVDFNADQVFLQLAPLAVDASTFEIWGALLHGAVLVLFPSHQPTFDELNQIIHDNGITTMRLTADMFHRMVETHLDALAPLKQLVIGGDVLSVSHVNRALEALPNCKLVNGYGPTENTTYTCCYSMIASRHFENSIPIGVPIANTQVYILDVHLQPVPVGVVGELYIGGDGLARGYLNRPDLTAQKFIPHPLMEHKGLLSDEGQERLYKTGDLACYQHDGTLEFHGRVDLQVKVRGYRVELEEVEAAIRQHPGIHDVIVAYRDIPRKRTAINEADMQVNEKGLVAYIVPVKGGDTLTPTVRSFLESKLPSHMIPALTVVLDALPCLPNEKIDRQALPDPEAKVKEFGFSRLPRDPIEASIAEIWCEVLGVDEIGIDENFFNVGGHSLLATQVLARVKGVFQVELYVRCLFKNPTVEAFAARVAEAQRERCHVPEVPIGPLPREEGFSLAFSQERMWFLNQLEEGGTAYTMPLAVRLTGPLQIGILETCINEIRRRHEVLRTTIEAKEGRPIPLVHPFEKVSLPIVGLQKIPEHQRELEFQLQAVQEIHQPFDLVCGPLFRATLFRFHDQEHVLLVTMHHVITDTWSLSVFFQELEALYPAFSNGYPSPLPELTIQYADFAHWQRKWLRGEVLDTQLAYWKSHLANASCILNLPTDRPRPVRQTFRGARHTKKLPDDLMERLGAFCRQEGVTLFMVMLSVFKVLLFRYTGKDDLLVGTPIANRRWLETEKLIGAFVNTLVLRTDLSGEPTFRMLLARVKDTTLEAYTHQDLPFEQLVAALHLKRDISRSPIFQIMFSMPNVPMPKLHWTDLGIEVMDLDRGGSQFDLTLFVQDIPGQGHTVLLEYNTDLFNAGTIKRLLAHYLSLLESVLNNSDQSIATLPMITEGERQQLLVAWNNTGVENSNTRCLHNLFEQQVEKTPDAVAVVCEGERVTYQELNQRANQVAHHLRKWGVGSETLVGILLDRSMDMLISLLGVLKAGGAYVPLDPAFPEGRLRLMVEDSKASVLITQDHLLDRIRLVPSHTNGSSRTYGGPKVVTMSSGVWDQESMDNPNALVHSTNLAYVIYTSGSTGQPKGVMIPHQGLVNFMQSMQREPSLGVQDRLLAVTSLSFDIAVLELFLPLVVGAQVVLASRETASDGAKLCRLLQESDATVMQGTPATWRILLQAGWEVRKGFRAFCGGEALPRILANQLLEKGVELWNFYGPTETTIWSAVHRVVPGEDVIPIGRPIANTQLYVLDRCLQPVPIGVPGELYIGGEGLARGYVNQPALTEQKFIPDPFRATPFARLYKTGDLAKYRTDGTVEFLGRLDHQVKIRGFRVELEEIEAILYKHSFVQHCLVVADDREHKHREDTSPEQVFEDKHLVAYVVPMDLAIALAPTNDREMDSCIQASCISELRELLGKSLPNYMVPSSFVFLEAFPLTPNGKIDRRKLPKPVEDGCLRLRSRAADTALEKQLVEIWRKVLGVQHVGVSDDFFEVGGHSLLANQVLARVHEDLCVDISVTTFFERPTIEHMAKNIETVRWLSESQSLNPCATSVDREGIRL